MVAMLRLLVLLLLFASPARAEEAIDAPTLAAVTALATRGYADPAAASVRDVHKSLARNGLGYCGTVSLADGSGFTVFHAILGEDGGAGSVLRLSEFPASDDSPTANAVRQMMRNVGCVE